MEGIEPNVYIKHLRSKGTRFVYHIPFLPQKAHFMASRFFQTLLKRHPYTSSKHSKHIFYDLVIKL